MRRRRRENYDTVQPVDLTQFNVESNGNRKAKEPYEARFKEKEPLYARCSECSEIVPRNEMHSMTVRDFDRVKDKESKMYSLRLCGRCHDEEVENLEEMNWKNPGNSRLYTAAELEDFLSDEELEELGL